MLARVLEHFGIDDPNFDSPRFLEALAERLRDRERMSKRSAQCLRCPLELRIMVALCLDVIAYPGLRSDQHARVGSAGVPFLRMALNFAQCGVESCNSLGNRRGIIG